MKAKNVVAKKVVSDYYEQEQRLLLRDIDRAEQQGWQGYDDSLTVEENAANAQAWTDRNKEYTIQDERDAWWKHSKLVKYDRESDKNEPYGDDDEEEEDGKKKSTVYRSAAPKKYDHINFKPPQGVADAAARGLRKREKWGRGGTSVGVARARDLKNRKNVSPETAKRMYNFFNRHEKNDGGKAPDGGPDAGDIAWDLWGGNPGRSWANKLWKQMESADEKAKKSRVAHEAPQYEVIFAFEGEDIDGDELRAEFVKWKDDCDFQSRYYIGGELAYSSEPIQDWNEAEPIFDEMVSRMEAEAEGGLEKVAKGRCWEGYEPVPGKEPYSDGSCRKIKKKKKKDSFHRESGVGMRFPTRIVYKLKTEGWQQQANGSWYTEDNVADIGFEATLLFDEETKSPYVRYTEIAPSGMENTDEISLSSFEKMLDRGRAIPAKVAHESPDYFIHHAYDGPSDLGQIRIELVEGDQRLPENTYNTKYYQCRLYIDGELQRDPGMLTKYDNYEEAEREFSGFVNGLIQNHNGKLRHFKKNREAIQKMPQEYIDRMDNREFYDWHTKKKFETRPIDRERYTDLSHEGLEGPFMLNSGKVVYYDTAEGKYYDRDSDMYLSNEEYEAHTRQSRTASREYNVVNTRASGASPKKPLVGPNRDLEYSSGAIKWEGMGVIEFDTPIITSVFALQREYARKAADILEQLSNKYLDPLYDNHSGLHIQGSKPSLRTTEALVLYSFRTESNEDTDKLGNSSKESMTQVLRGITTDRLFWEYLAILQNSPNKYEKSALSRIIERQIAAAPDKESYWVDGVYMESERDFLARGKEALVSVRANAIYDRLKEAERELERLYSGSDDYIEYMTEDGPAVGPYTSSPQFYAQKEKLENEIKDLKKKLEDMRSGPVSEQMPSEVKEVYEALRSNASQIGDPDRAYVGSEDSHWYVGDNYDRSPFGLRYYPETGEWVISWLYSDREPKVISFPEALANAQIWFTG
jgi:hypothetical protein